MDNLTKTHATQADASPQARLAWNRSFTALAVSQGINAVGDAVTMTAVPLMVVLESGTGAQIGLITALQLSPLVVIGLTAGAWADRSNTRTLILWSNIIRAGLMAIVPAVQLLEILSPVTALLWISILLGACNAVCMSAQRAMLPLIVPPAKVPFAASNLQAVASLGYVVGPGIAGFLATSVGPAQTLGVDALSFLLAGLAMLACANTPPSVRTQDFVDELREGVAFTFGNFKMRALLGLVVAMAIANAPLVPSLTLHCLRHNLGSKIIGIAVSAGAVGSVFGFLSASRYSQRVPIYQMLGGLLAAGLVNLMLGGVAHGPTLIVLVALSSLFNAWFLCLSLMVRTAITPPRFHGRVGGAVSVIVVAAMALGALLGGLLLDVSSGSVVLRLSGGLYVITALAFVRSRHLREAALALGHSHPAPSGSEA